MKSPKISGLDRGLKVLELLAESCAPIRFTDINAGLGVINRASLSRLLKILIRLEYVWKDPVPGV